MENGKAAVAYHLVGGVGAGSTEFHVVRPNEALVGKFLLYFVLQERVRRDARAQMTGTAGQLRVPESFYESLDLPLPPVEEQHRIAKAIDSYFTRLDVAQAALERVQANLKQYRASVLKAAVEGRLAPTEADLARKEGRDYEPASVLLERILVERRRRWEETELEKLIAKGKPPKNDKWRAKYKEPPAPDTSELPGLPEGWCWATLGQLGEVTGGLTQDAKRRGYPIKVPFLRVANVYANRLELHDVRSIGVHQGELDRVQLHEGDMLVVEGNGSPDQIGRVALWDGSVEPCAHQNHLIKVRFTLPDTAVWAVRYMLSPGGRKRVRRVASSTSGLHTLSISKVSRLPIAMPPLAEQSLLAATVDSLLGVSTRAELDVGQSLARCAGLRQSVLRSAFDGGLVDHDPTDEPAGLLLA